MKVSYDFLCLDERDSPNLTELRAKTRVEIKSTKNRRHFGLCGVIVPGAEYPELNVYGRKIQEKCFGMGNYQPFHYVEILNNKGRFANLGTDKNLKRSLVDNLNNLISKTKFKIIATFVDKQNMALEHGVFTDGKLSRIRKIRPNLTKEVSPKSINLYEISLKFILNEYYRYLSARKKRGLIIAEARGEKEDINLLNSFYQYQKVGTGSLSGKEIRSYITDLLIIRKSQNHIGIQLADLVTYPLYDHFVGGHNTRSDHFIKKASYEKKIINIKLFP